MKLSAFAAIFDDADRILLVRMAYGNGSWTTPGGGVEDGETMEEAVVREVLEETGYLVKLQYLIGAYSKQAENELLMFFRASILDRVEWSANDEIAEIGFFGQNELPLSMNDRPRLRITDAFSRERGLIRSF